VVVSKGAALPSYGRVPGAEIWHWMRRMAVKSHVLLVVLQYYDCMYIRTVVALSLVGRAGTIEKCPRS